MELFTGAVDLFLHLDRHLESVIESYGAWTYAILTVIVFAETGLVVTPFLPGDSLLFAAGTFAARGSLSALVLFALLAGAAIAGDTVNYWVGKNFGHWLTARPDSRWLRKQHIERTHAFFEKYGAKTIVIARFVPIVRTFAPFVAGLGTMTYSTFLFYNVLGGVLWVAGFVAGGYWFGGLPVVKNNFSLVVLVIIVLSVMPVVVEFLRARSRVPQPPT